MGPLVELHHRKLRGVGLADSRSYLIGGHIAIAVPRLGDGRPQHDDTGAPVILSGYAVQMWDAMRALDGALTRTSGNTRDTDAFIDEICEAITAASMVSEDTGPRPLRLSPLEAAE